MEALTSSKQNYQSRSYQSRISRIIHFSQSNCIEIFENKWYEQKQPSRGVLMKGSSENMQQIYMRTPMPKCDFNKVAWVYPINLLHIFKTSFTKNTSGWLLLYNPTKELLKNNIINAYVFETALQDLLTNRRRNSRSIISYGPANSRKTSILNLSLLFLKYLLIQLQVSCCWSRKNRSISINDFQ